MRFIENTKSAIVLYVLFHCTRGECNGTRSIALLGNGIFYSISRDHKQPIKRLEFNKVLYKMHCSIPTLNTALVFMLMIHGDLTPSNLERRASLLGI
jgi:hypothetical protein